jgi:hypothetical protein
MLALWHAFLSGMYRDKTFPHFRLPQNATTVCFICEYKL